MNGSFGFLFSFSKMEFKNLGLADDCRIRVSVIYSCLHDVNSLSHFVSSFVSDFFRVYAKKIYC